jgi:hypothetical protein
MTSSITNSERDREGAVPWSVRCFDAPIVTGNQTIFGGTALTPYTYHVQSNLLKTLAFCPKKLCPLTKIAAILNL